MKDSRFEFHHAESNPEIDANFSGQSAWRESIYRFRKNKGAMAALFVILLIVLFSLIGPMVSGHTYDEVNSAMQNLPPRIPILEKLGICNGVVNGVNVYEQKGLQDVYYFFGTDTLGRDAFTRVASGTRISLLVAVVAVAVDIIFGVGYGLVSGYFGGKVDLVMQRITEIVYGIPRLVIVTLLMIILKPGLISIIISLLISGWIGMSRLVRAQVLKLKEQEYVLASRTLGASDFTIITGEILPNTLSQIIVMAMMSVPEAIFTESFLSYIGLGIPAPRASLGVLINDGYKSMMLYPYLLAVPAAVFAVLMVCLNLVADGFRDAFDPKMADM
jgi:oligopeptide transport system permease protein